MQAISWAETTNWKSSPVGENIKSKDTKNLASGVYLSIAFGFG